MNAAVQQPFRTEGVGTVTPPPGMTVGDMEAAVKAAEDEARRRRTEQPKEG